MKNCFIKNGRFQGYLGDVNIKGLSGATYGRVSSLTDEQRVTEGIYKYVAERTLSEGVPEATPEAFLIKIDETTRIDGASFIKEEIYKLASVESILEAKLATLAELRYKAQQTGFDFKGQTIKATRDIQSDISSMALNYMQSMVPESAPMTFKVKNGTSITLAAGDPDSPTRGVDGLRELGVMLGTFIQQECFGKEAAVASLLSKMSAEELAIVDVSELFKPNPDFAS